MRRSRRFTPRLGAYVEHVRGDSPSGYLFKAIDRRQLPPGVDFNAPGRFRNYEAGMRASFNLFNGGRDVLARRMAETALRVQELDRRNIENALISSLIRTYYNTRAARDYIDIATESVATVESELKLMRVRYRAGGALKSDVLSLEVRLAQTREDVVRAENGHSLALASLADILGLDPDLRLAPTGEGDVPMEVPAEYEAGIPRALASRPELMKVREELLRSRMGIDSARAGYLPRVDARASYYMDDADAGFETSRDNWIAGIILNWDLYTGRSTDARVRKASHLLDEMRAADRKTVQSIRLDVKTAYLKLNEARARVAVTEAGVAQAEESLRLVRKQFEGGSATITRYLDAELARNRARLNAVAAFYDRQTAVADVGRAVGLWAEYAQGVLTDVH